MKVFLGGTCNASTWRDKLIPLLKCDYYNPVVPEWNSFAQEMEEKEKASADHRLYVITNRITEFYSIAEVVHDSILLPNKVIFAVIEEDDSQVLFTKHQTKSLEQIEKMVEKFGVKVCYSLREIAEYLNNHINAKYRLCTRSGDVVFRSEPMTIAEIEIMKQSCLSDYVWAERVSL